MAHTIEGNDNAGYRVLDSDGNALTGRKATEKDALDAAGIRETKPRNTKKTTS